MVHTCGNYGPGVRALWYSTVLYSCYIVVVI